ncbi:hypothetical protein LUZ61_000434 [Rhynchospora tenuis]|uniref:HAT C-terminal dimerisation domain-containing protein n=1 Tax=Rhynchospora tenuis TaxID=198213 RepID=A0AAD6EPT9_9POAL|nr:hypothetical protein LUZ61_000434 [Rhynchospora tenuis]
MASDQPQPGHFANPNPNPIETPSTGSKRARSPSLDLEEADQPWSDQDPLSLGKEISTEDTRPENQIKEVMHNTSPIDQKPEGNQDRENQEEEEKEVLKAPSANNQIQEEESNNESVHSTDGGLLSSITESLVKMVMTDELPFHTITGIYPLSRSLLPGVPLPSISKLKEDLIRVHQKEKSQLKKIIKTHRVCLSTETWVDEGEMYHMSIRAHWINKEWCLCNKVLTFRWVPHPYPGTEETEELVTELGEIWEKCLKDWGIESVISITVGKTCTEAGAVEYLKNRTKDKNGAVLGHEFLHHRSCTHVIAEVVKEVLESEKETVRKIRDTIRFVGSGERNEHFKKCAKEENLEHQGYLFVNIEPMWDSVYMMLDEATKLQKAFERLLKEDPVYLSCFYPPEEEDEKYDWWGNKIEKEVVLNPGPPTEADWDNAKRLAKLLRLFYKVVLRLSDPLFPTSNLFFEEVLGMRTRLAQLCLNEDKLLGSLAECMKNRLDEYWGDLSSLNPLIYIALVLDPRKKLKYIRFYLSEIDTESSLVESIVEQVEATLVRLFEQYLEFEPEESLSGSDSDLVYFSEDEDYSEKLRVQFFKLIEKERKGNRILELKQYLTVSCETDDGSFDILDWWEANCMKYPVLSKIAMDVLAIPASAAFYEQAFSTGFRELVWHKSRLSGKLREALICGQDWFNYKKPPADFKESFIDEMAIEYGEEPEDDF